jgi:hypothetical protein
MWKAIVLASLAFQTTAIVSAQAPPQSAPPPKVRWVHERGKTLTLVANGQTVWVCHFAKEDVFPYFHPVSTVGGTVLTEMGPADHAHHRAMWLAWKYLNGVNYWDWVGKKESVPDGRTERVGDEKVEIGHQGATLVLNLCYSAAGKPVMDEKRTIVFGLPRPDGSYTMDWRMMYTARDKDVVFDRTPPAEASWGGYAGLSYRATPAMRDFRVLDSEGRKDMAGHGKNARWMDLSGVVDDKGQAAGVAMFDHPANPRHPTPWFMVVDGFRYINPAFVFAEPYTLPAGKSCTLHYRVLVHEGMGDRARLDKEFEAFKAEK